VEVALGDAYAGVMAPRTDSAAQRDGAARGRKHNSSPRKGDLRRDEILDGAERLLETSPVIELTFERLAAATGVPRSSIYFYFDSKWAVVDALIDRASADLLAEAQAVAPEADFDDFLRELTRAALRSWRTHRAVFLAAVERSSHADEATDRWRAIMADFVSLLTERLDLEAGDPARVDVRAVGGAAMAAELICWMTERTFYMLFAREHTTAEEEMTTEAIVAANRRILGVRSQS
jgi:AcrR family transcriptional regulator